jgi:hypothetical protein
MPTAIYNQHTIHASFVVIDTARTRRALLLSIHILFDARNPPCATQSKNHFAFDSLKLRANVVPALDQGRQRDAMHTGVKMKRGYPLQHASACNFLLCFQRQVLVSWSTFLSMLYCISIIIQRMRTNTQSRRSRTSCLVERYSRLKGLAFY